MIWEIRIAKRAEKFLTKVPTKDQSHILQALEDMRVDPFGGDIAKLKDERSAWRRRVGNYRLFFDVYPDRKIIDIIEIARRTSNTY